MFKKGVFVIVLDIFKKGVFVIVLFFLFSQLTFANNYVEKTIDGFKFRYIKYDSKSSDYIFKIGANLDYNASNLRDLMEANNGISAINGVYFCPANYSECGGKNFTNNERYVLGTKIGSGITTQNRVVFAIDKNNNPFLFQTNKINSEDESKINYGFANFPLLLQDGINKYQDYVDLGLIDTKMKMKMQRNFICSDISNRYIFSGYVSEIKLEKLPELLVKLGCNNALNLDAGGSSAFIYNSRYIIGPGRNILDGIIIERKNLDTKKIIEKAKLVKLLVEKKIIKKSFDEKNEFINNLSVSLSKIRTIIYDKNSIDLYDSKTGLKNGYEINIRSIKNLEIVYLINYLNKLLTELKEVYISENVEKINKEKEKINKENLLF